MRKRKRWFAGVAIYDGDWKDLHFLVMRSVPLDTRYSPKEGLSGGMRGRLDQTTYVTALRETREEFGLTLKEDEVPVAMFTILDRGEEKVFYLFHRSSFEGELRTTDKIDGDTKLEPPRPVSAGEAMLILTRAHGAAVEDFIEHLSLKTIST